jgi:oligo-1,6-glucosidase
MTNTGFTEIDQYRDIESVNYHAEAMSLGLEVEAVLESLSLKSRDNARTPMHWDDSEHAGFTTGTPWLPVTANKDEINAAAAVADPDSVFHHFRKLIELRHENPVVVEGRFDLLLPDHERVWAFTRTLGDDALLVLANCSSEIVTVAPDDVPDVVAAKVLLATHDETDGLDLQPWESRIYAL